jgi:cell fate (sporulation/competence/biofilm development) regulator YlbF (YheA/YmcA/DUF963 family)
MNTQSAATSPVLPAASQQTAAQAARALGGLLFNTPEYQAYRQALHQVNRDADVQRLLASIRERTLALQRGQGDTLEHRAALETLRAELGALPSFCTYRQEEENVAGLFHAVDEAIGRAAGVAFARNARRSGCGCGC